MTIKEIIKKMKSDTNFKDENLIKQISEAIEKISQITNSSEENRIKIFELAEEKGIHITPVHFYQSIPDTKSIPKNIFEKPYDFSGININDENQLLMLQFVWQCCI